MSNHNQKTISGATRSTKSSHGFTLIELLIVAPIIILVIGAFISMIISMTGSVLTTRGANALAYNIQDSLNRIESDVKMSGGYLAINNIDLSTNPIQGYDNNTTYNASTSNFHNATTDTTIGPMLILNTNTTTDNPVSSTRNIIYKNSPNACNLDAVSQNPPLVMNVIYFVKNNTLWRRTIAKSTYATDGCFVPWQQPSCSPGIVNAFCKTTDVRLVDGVSPIDGFVINYYTDINAPAENLDAKDGTKSDAIRQIGLSTAKTARVTIKATATISGRDITQSGSIIVVSPNNNIAN